MYFLYGMLCTMLFDQTFFEKASKLNTILTNPCNNECTGCIHVASRYDSSYSSCFFILVEYFTCFQHCFSQSQLIYSFDHH